MANTVVVYWDGNVINNQSDGGDHQVMVFPEEGHGISMDIRDNMSSLYHIPCL